MVFQIHQVGSGPLMTYLKSDGDIDLTVVTPSGKKIVNDVLLVLESEKEKGRNTQARSSADLVINDVQHIPAEVILIYIHYLIFLILSLIVY